MVAITGTPQAGKTWLARYSFPGMAYVSLEDPNEWAMADEDPNFFLARFPDGVIIDGIDRAIGLISYIRSLIEADRRPGRYILIGSQQLELALKINQLMGGLAARLPLLPLSLVEQSQNATAPASLDEHLWRGSMPALADQSIDPTEWYGAYINRLLSGTTPPLMGVRDPARFLKFMKLCAMQTGRMINYSELGMGCDVSHVTAASWISLLEELHLIAKLPPHKRGFGKRVVKTPKLYFLDSGLAAWLADIRSPAMLSLHPLRNKLFETWVVSEFIKARWSQGRYEDLYFWRDNFGTEVELMFDINGQLQPIGIRAGATPNDEWLIPLKQWRRYAGLHGLPAKMVYAGIGPAYLDATPLIPWQDISEQAGRGLA
ncbi:MAG: DUF4143 domain-containing protein [Sphingomonadaceae bacterium]|nr:DUF4143 domain-containing protein [Sphingomonadaceae bacterium]